MTVSTADIPVLHSTEVAHLYPQAMLPICLPRLLGRGVWDFLKLVELCKGLIV
jgi:hypothetical protein